MAENIGGEHLGGPAVALGNQKQLFDNITVDGECHGMDLLVTGNLISSGSAFNAKNPTGASKTLRGADDLDALLDFIYAAASFRVDQDTYLFQNELMSRVRRYFISPLTARDVQASGCLVDGTQLNATGGATKAFGLIIPIPFSVRDELENLDGDVYKQGTERLKLGGAWLPNFANIAGNVVLQNGTAVLSGLAFDSVPNTDGKGDKFYVGPTLAMKSSPTQPATLTERYLGRKKRVFMFVEGINHGPYTQHGVVERNKHVAANVIDQFNRNRRRDGGDNTCAAGVPVIFPRKDITNDEMNMTPTTVYLKDEGGQTMDIVEVTHEPIPPTSSSRVQGAAQISAGSKQLVQKRPTPPSAAYKGGVKPANASKLGIHFTIAPKAQ